MRKFRSMAVAGILGLAGLLAAGASSASPIVFQTATGATAGGNPVSAQAVFALGTNTLEIGLGDSLANPITVAQLISGLSFALSNGLSIGSLSSSGAYFIAVSTSGSFAAAGSGATSWLLQTGTSGFDLCEICANGINGSAGPAELIIGPPSSSNGYSAANRSIAGNAPHNPFINNVAFYTLDIPGLSSSDTISNVVFRFGTTFGEVTSDGVCTASCGGASVPEPGTLALFAAGLLGCALFIHRRRRAARQS